MIDDIVVLPRTLKQFNREATVSSELLLTLPISAITREVGYESPCDDDWVKFGGTTEVITGKDTWFRFKIVENTQAGIAEYFCLTESPIDFYNPRNSSKLKIYCPWLTVTNRKTFKTRKFILWRHIFELIRYETEDNVIDAPIEAVIANEIKNFASIYGCDHFMRELEYYPSDYKNVLISEAHPNFTEGSDALDTLTMLGSNIRSYLSNYDMMPFSMFEPDDIFRNLHLPKQWTDYSVIRDCSVLPYLQFGTLTLGEIAHLFSPRYQLHSFQRGFSQPSLDPWTVLDIPSEDKQQLFTIIKYAEEIPYGEFELSIDSKGCSLKVYNPYNMGPFFGNQPIGLMKSCETETKAILTDVSTGFPQFKRMTLARSWSEEIYITVTNNDESVERFYYDMSVASTCSRSLIRDYNGNMFVSLV